jgi:hypothetical protein
MRDVGYGLQDAEGASSLIFADDRDVKRAETQDEKILYIADKLDLLGVDGTIRLLIEHGNQGLTIRHDLAVLAAKKQKDWVDYMLSLSVAANLVRARYAEATTLLDTLSEPTLNL